MSQAVSAAVARPAHIPESAVYDFDMFLDPAYLADPHRRVLDLVRTAPPVFWTPRNGGPKAMLALKEDIRTLANQLIDSVISRGRCDFMVDTLWIRWDA
jgi:hypothetical protein